MPKGTNQKLKLYYLSKILMENTDDEHSITMSDIISKLDGYDVSADRKSIYDDLNTLRDLGLDVIGEKDGRNYYYHVGKKMFDIAELKLLVDSVQSSKFITARKSNELINKITSFASRYEAGQLKRQIVTNDRVKTRNESIYYFVDDIHRAITENKKIRFHYMHWNTEKKLIFKKEGWYYASPWALTWFDGNYYLIAYVEDSKEIRHFRVDKIKDTECLDTPRDGKELFKQFDLSNYAKMNFNMFRGEKVSVRLAFENELVGVFIDRFGRDIIIKPFSKEGWSQTNVDICLSDHFLGWIFAFGTHVKILGPEKVINAYKEALKNASGSYSA